MRGEGDQHGGAVGGAPLGTELSADHKRVDAAPDFERFFLN